MMLTLRVPLFLAVVLTVALASRLAHADIYTWTDSSGRVTISNLPPPDGVRVTHVAHESPVPPAVRDEAARDAARRAEVQALADRVRQLEDEVELAKRQPPPPMDYRAALAPPPYPYPSEIAPPPPQYGVNVAPPASYGCDVTWINCLNGWGPVYPASVVVLRDPRYRRFHPGQPGRHANPRNPPPPHQGPRPPGATARSDARGGPIAAGPPQGTSPLGGTARSDARGGHMIAAARGR